MSETVVQESMNETTAKIVFLFINDMEFALVIDASLDRSHLSANQTAFGFGNPVNPF